MRYYLWKCKIGEKDYSIFAIAATLENAQNSAIRNTPRDCRSCVREAVQSKPKVIEGPYSFFVQAQVDFDCTYD